MQPVLGGIFQLDPVIRAGRETAVQAQADESRREPGRGRDIPDLEPRFAACRIVTGLHGGV